MKIIIVHLSDIHIKENTTILKERATKIVDGIKNIESDIVKVIFAITGDIAYSGKQEEYEIVATFFDELNKQVSTKICKSISFVIVPGNHDCLFIKGNEDARDQIIETLKSKEYKISGNSIIDLCLNNQKNFFSYCFDFYCDEPVTNYNGLFYQFSFETSEFKVSFNCINSSWISKLNETEQYGKLGFPTDYLKDALESDFTISLFHHPYNWFSLSNSKELKQYLVANSDIVLTGHEHEPDHSGYIPSKGKKYIDFIEGGVLINDSDHDESSFNAIFIDISKRSHKIYQLYLDNQIYLNDGDSDWVSNNHNKIKLNGYKLNDYQQKWLIDPGATIYYKYDDESLLLDEIFVFPELKETFTDEDTIKLDEKISAEILLQVDEKANRFFIVGSEYIGKTILLKKLFSHFYKLGLIPVYIEGSDIKESSPDSFKKLVYECLLNQYDKNDIEKLKQEDQSKLYILIDNFHHCNLPLKYKARFIDSNFVEQEGRQIFPNVIFCGNDYMQFEELIYKDENTINPLVYFKSYKLLPFGVGMRYKLIEKWYRNKRRNLEEFELIKKIEFAEKLIDSNLTYNLMMSDGHSDFIQGLSLGIMQPLICIICFRLKQPPALFLLPGNSLQFL